MNLLETTGVLSLEQIATNVVVALIMGMLIYLSYYISHSGTIYSKKFNVSLVMLTLVTAIVMTVIQNNIALSLGTIGALSIVRFRTAIKDPRDTVYIFWSIAMGLCCGISCFSIAAIGAAVIFIFLLIFGKLKNTDRLLIIIKGSRNDMEEIESIMFNYFNNYTNLRVKNTTKDSCEYIYEISRSNYIKYNMNEMSIIDALYKIKNISYVNVVAQNDEING